MCYFALSFLSFYLPLREPEPPNPLRGLED